MPRKSVRKTVMIVEDDEPVRQSLVMLLELYEYETMQAANGKQALDLLKNHGAPDLILLDLMMPVMNGWEFVRHYREADYYRKIPFLLLSADVDLESKASELGAIGYVSKPFQARELLETIARQLKD